MATSKMAADGTAIDETAATTAPQTAINRIVINGMVINTVDTNGTALTSHDRPQNHGPTQLDRPAATAAHLDAQATRAAPCHAKPQLYRAMTI